MYLSELLNRKVRDASDLAIGRLQDILVVPQTGAYPALRFLAIQTARPAALVFVPYEYVANVSPEEIALKNLWKTIPTVTPEAGCIFLNRDVLDEQIVDVEGARVMRVNDLKLGIVENLMCVLGIDVSFKGILRRLGLGSLDLFSAFKVNLIDWRKAHPVKGTVKLDTIAQELERLHPADLANVIEDLTTKQGGKLVRSLHADAAAHVIEEMDPEIQQLVIHYLGPERAAEIVDRMSVDEVVDLLKALPRQEARQFLSYLQGSKLQKVQKLIAYPDDTAGGMMMVDFATARPGWTVLEAIEEIKRLSPTLRSIIHLYITDEAGYFQGAVSLRRLLVVKPDHKLRDIMKRLPKTSTLRITDKIDRIIKLMTKYDLYTAAVLDQRNKLVGVVAIDDVMRHLVPNA